MPKLTLIALEPRFAICRLSAEDPIPAWAASAEFSSFTRTHDELSIVCPQENVPPDVRSDSDWRCLGVVGTLELEQVGILAALVRPLADAGVPVFVISTFNTDFLLVKSTSYETACHALRAEGVEIRD